MKYVCLLQSTSSPNQRYIGITDNLNNRLDNHDSGGSPHTARFRPWKVTVAIRFEDHDKAVAFEKYLESGSGRAFANKRFW